MYVFCDAYLLAPGAPSLFATRVARQLAEWLLIDEAARVGTRLRSGTYINVTDMDGTLVSGVMSGGTKDPLGAMV